MIKKILLGLAAIVAVILLVAAFQPSAYRIERSLAIAASPAEIYAQTNDLRKSAVWSPWLKLDPNAKVTYEGPATGVGASSTWEGNSDIGAGRQTITESRPNELVRIRLDFEKPFKATSMSDFVIKPQGGQTVVSWSIAGDNNYLGKIFCLFMNQDKMVGGQFEKGLSDLKTLVESAKK